MSDHDPHRPNLSEISHLFLSSVRDRQTGGAPRPTRTPPGQRPPRPAVSIDLTPEEFAQVCADAPAAPSEPVRRVPVTAVLASHLNGTQFDRVKQYARHLAGRVGRVGLIEIDAAEFRLMSFEPSLAGDEPVLGESTPVEGYDPSHVAGAINELHCDVDQWLVLLPSPRTPEARAVLRLVRQWVLLTTCDHDGIVSCYRTLKGLADMHSPGEADGDPGVPALTLAALGDDDAEADRVFQKLSGVCRQFLHWPIDCEPRVGRADDVAEHLLMCVRPTRDKAQMASQAQWAVVENFLKTVQDQSIKHNQPVARAGGIDMNSVADSTDVAAARHVADIQMPDAMRADACRSDGNPAPATITVPQDPFKLMPLATPTPASAGHAAAAEVIDEVVDLSGTDGSSGSILTAIVRHEAGGLIECPVRPPMCPDARLAVDRQRGLVLLAVSRTGLADLRLIGQAYRWLIENRPLIGMAVPQLAIDAHQLPRLRLLVDQADLSADTLQPLVHSGNVTVQAYRKLRWGGKSGLLLQQAA